MLNNNAPMTPTLAKMLARQGHLEQAAEAYRTLLEQTPGHVGFQKALADIQTQLHQSRKKGDTLTPLFEEWIRLVLSYNQLRYCKNLRRKDG